MLFCLSVASGSSVRFEMGHSVCLCLGLLYGRINPGQLPLYAATEQQQQQQQQRSLPLQHSKKNKRFRCAPWIGLKTLQQAGAHATRATAQHDQQQQPQHSTKAAGPACSVGLNNNINGSEVLQSGGFVSHACGSQYASADAANTVRSPQADGESPRSGAQFLLNGSTNLKSETVAELAPATDGSAAGKLSEGQHMEANGAREAHAVERSSLNSLAAAGEVCPEDRPNTSAAAAEPPAATPAASQIASLQSAPVSPVATTDIETEWEPPWPSSTAVLPGVPLNLCLLTIHCSCDDEDFLLRVSLDKVCLRRVCCC